MGNSQVITIFNFWTDYGNKYVILIELCMKEDPLKGNNSCKIIDGNVQIVYRNLEYFDCFV
jgi:hypothetical protein